jgi:hypothetical protein
MYEHIYKQRKRKFQSIVISFQLAVAQAVVRAISTSFGVRGLIKRLLGIKHIDKKFSQLFFKYREHISHIANVMLAETQAETKVIVKDIDSVNQPGHHPNLALQSSTS